MGKRGPNPSSDRDEWQRATFHVRKEYLVHMKRISFRDRTSMKKILDEALKKYLISMMIIPED